MRKLTFCAMMICLMISGAATTLKAENETPIITEPIESPEVRTQVLVDRLYEIKEMDLKSLKPAEKKELRKEVREIKSELKAGGVYLSVGVILLILLIVLLI